MEGASRQALLLQKLTEFDGPTFPAVNSAQAIQDQHFHQQGVAVAISKESSSGISGQLSVDEHLKKQGSAASAVTLEAVDGSPTLVRLTPWRSGAGCSCHLAIEVPKDSISHVVPTGDEHPCCGKILQVVQVHFKEGSAIATGEVLRQISSRAARSTHSSQLVHEHLGVPAATPSMSSAPNALGIYHPGAACASSCERSYQLCLEFGGFNCDCNYRNCVARCYGRPQQRCLPDF